MPNIVTDPDEVGFDPDTPLDYLTMRDDNGDLWVATVTTSGTWSLEGLQLLLAEDGDTLTTEAGDQLRVE